MDWDWSTFAGQIPFRDIMTKLGLESPESLLRCMKVCRTWNAEIESLIIKDSQGRKKLKERFERSWSLGMLPTDEEIANANWLGEIG